MENVSSMCSSIKKKEEVNSTLEAESWNKNGCGNNKREWNFFFKMEMQYFALFKYIKPPWQKLNLTQEISMN